MEAVEACLESVGLPARTSSPVTWSWHNLIITIIVSPEYNPNSWRAQWRFLGRRRRQASDPTPCHRHGDDDDDDDDDDEDLIPDHHNCNKDPG